MIPLLAVLFHCPPDDVFQFHRQVGIDRRRRRRLPVHHRVQRGHNICTGERLFPRSHLIQHHAEREDIRSRVQRLIPRLFRGHIHRGSRQHTHSGQRIFLRRTAVRRDVLVAYQLGQAKVEDLRAAVSSKEDIRRLDIAMNNAFGMRRDQRIRHLDRDLEQLLHLHGFAMQPLLQALPLQLLHDDEGVPVVIVDFVNRADVGMVQLRGRPRFPLKAVERLTIPNQVVRNELQSDMPAQAGVFGFIHYSHAAAAQFSQNAIVGDRLTDHGKSPLRRAPNVRPVPPSGQPHPSCLSINVSIGPSLLFRERLNRANPTHPSTHNPAEDPTHSIFRL